MRSVCQVPLNKIKRQVRVGSEKKGEKWRKKFRARSRLEKIENAQLDRRKLENEICGVFPQ
jgi:hypothetical protein